jgi:isoleucyl-tRNA synthetase
VREELVLDYARLGKRLRGDVKAVARAVAEGKAVRQEGGGWLAAGHTIAPDELEVRLRPLAGDDAVATEGALVLALDLVTDEALVREGWARDLNRALQDLRKQARLGYDERVVVSVVGEEVEAALGEHHDWLQQQCLAVRIERQPLSEPLASTSVEIGGYHLTVALVRA